MKFSLRLLVFTLFTTSLFGQSQNRIQLSETITTKTKDINNFDKIDVSEDFKVYVRFSNGPESVKIEANKNLHDLINVEKKGETLKISTKSYSSGNGDTEEVLVAYITTKNLTAITGDEDVYIELEDQLNAENLSINLDEDCSLKGHIAVQNLVVELDEDSVLDIKGSANSMDLEAREDSMIKGFDFVVGNLDIDLSGDSEAKLTVNGDIKLRASGDSFFHQKGQGKFTSKRLTGDSELKTK